MKTSHHAQFILYYGKKGTDMKNRFIIAVGILSFIPHVTTIANSNKKNDINEVIYPAAGLGTRQLSCTKAFPKELLPILNTPAAYYVAQEAVDAGLDHHVWIINKNKQAIVDYFSSTTPVEKFLKKNNKTYLTADLNALIEQIECTYIEQPTPRGLGHAILQAKPCIKQQYFAVILPDNLVSTDCLSEMKRLAHTYNAMVIGVQEVPRHEVPSYGQVITGARLEPGVFHIKKLIEKPALKDVCSNLVIMGRYILSTDIFPAIEAIKPEAGREIQLTDALDQLIQAGVPIIAYTIKGKRLDTGTPLNWIKTNIFYALHRSPYAQEVIDYIMQEINNRPTS